MKFINENALYLLLVLPFFVLIILLGGIIVRRQLRLLGGAKIADIAGAGYSTARRVLKNLLFLSGMGMLILALARPQYGSELVKIKTSGSHVMIALDVSLSMLAADFYPNRLEKARREILALLEKLPADNFGLIAFSGQAFVQCPLTVDHSAVRMFLSIIKVGIISDTGTNIEKAIEKASACFPPDDAEKVLVIFTDGENQEGDAVSAARKHKNDFRIFTVGVGTPKGEPIPIRNPDGSIADYKKDSSGQLVLSKLNQGLLAEIAEAASGSSFIATPGEHEIDELADRIRGFKKGETEGSFKRIYKEVYQYFLIPGLLMIGLSMFIGERRDYAA